MLYFKIDHWNRKINIYIIYIIFYSYIFLGCLYIIYIHILNIFCALLDKLSYSCRKIPSETMCNVCTWVDEAGVFTFPISLLLLLEIISELQLFDRRPTTRRLNHTYELQFLWLKAITPARESATSWQFNPTSY